MLNYRRVTAILGAFCLFHLDSQTMSLAGYPPAAPGAMSKPAREQPVSQRKIGRCSHWG